LSRDDPIALEEASRLAVLGNIRLRVRRRDKTTKSTRIRRGFITEVRVRWVQNGTLGNIEICSDVFAINRSIASLRCRESAR